MIAAMLPAPEPIRVLTVDDHPLMREGIAAVLGEQPDMAPVGEAADGWQGLQAFERLRPDVTLMDIQMPGMDGLECARRLREQQAQGRLPRFPILALTAHALDSDVADSLKAGMDEHLTKPLDFLTLRRRLARWLDLPQLND